MLRPVVGNSCGLAGCVALDPRRYESQVKPTIEGIPGKS